MDEKEKYRKALGREIARLRELAGMTQQELANRAACPWRSLAQYESGILAPSAYQLEQIRKALDVDYIKARS